MPTELRAPSRSHMVQIADSAREEPSTKPAIVFALVPVPSGLNKRTFLTVVVETTIMSGFASLQGKDHAIRSYGEIA